MFPNLIILNSQSQQNVHHWAGYIEGVHGTAFPTHHEQRNMSTCVCVCVYVFTLNVEGKHSEQ